MTSSVGDNGYASRVADTGRDHDRDRRGLMAKMPRPVEDLRKMPLTIDDLFLSQRAEKVIYGKYKCRTSGNQSRPITSVAELVAHTKSQFARRVGAGRVTIAEIEEQLARFGLAFERNQP